MIVLLVAVGAAIGAPLRYLVTQAVQGRHGSRFPWGTLLVNVVGSLLLGFLIGLPVGPAWMAVAGTGLCGALTTYSTFSLETMRLVEKGVWGLAVVNVALSLVLGVGAGVVGLAAAQAIG